MANIGINDRAIGQNVAGQTYIQLSTATFLWSGVFVVGKQSLEVLDPMFLAAARFMVAGLAVMISFSFIERWQKLRLADLPNLTYMALLGVVGYNILFLIALDLSSPLHGLVIIATTPAITVLINSIQARKFPSVFQVLGMGLAFVAVLLVILGNGKTITPAQAVDVLMGDLLFVAAAITWAFYSLKTRDWVRDRDATAMTAGSLVVGSLIFIPIAILFCDVPKEIQAMRPVDVAAILYMGLLATVAAFILWNLGLKAIGPARTSVFLNLVPIWGTILTALTIGQWPSVVTLTATAMAIIGIFIVQRR